VITIRLQRRGRKNDPSFRVVVVDSKKKPKTGNYLEMVGSHDPRQDRTELRGERITHWIKNGATLSDTVHNLLVSHKIIDAKKINILPAFKAAPIVEAPAEAAKVEGAEASNKAEENPVEQVVEETLEQEAAPEPVEEAVAQEVPAE